MEREPEGQSNQPLDVDIAIIGAGPAGLYVAWRLMQTDEFKSQKICLFDAADQIGGRVASVCVPGIPFVADVGAMRYLPHQVLVGALTRELKLTSDNFEFDTTFYSLRGQLLTKAAFQRPGRRRATSSSVSVLNQLPYTMDEQREYSKNPFQLIAWAIQKALSKVQFDRSSEEAARAIDVNIQLLRSRLQGLESSRAPLSLRRTFQPKEWRFIKRYGCIDNIPLHKMGFWDLLQDNLTTEGYALAHDGGGYQSIFSMWNAAEAIIWFLADFSSDNYQTIVGGMDKLTTGLYDQIVAWAQENGKSNADVCMLNRTLVSICAEGEGNARRFQLEFNQNNLLEEPLQTVIAQRVILALPQPALKNLCISGIRSESLDDSMRIKIFHGLLESVTPNPLFKLFLVYNKSWWTDLPGCEDVSFKVNTDQPLRQIYHFGPNRQHPKPEQNSKESAYRLVMASYSDARYAEYWNQLHKMRFKDTRDEPPEPPYCSEEFRKSLPSEKHQELETILKKYGTTQFVVRRAQEQLRRVYNEETLAEPIIPPDPLIALFQHWSDPPYYAGWHSWNIGIKPWLYARELIQPFPGFAIFTCGEAFSSEQGWIEGALKSAEHVLERLGLSEPPWLKEKERKDYHDQKMLWL